MAVLLHVACSRPGLARAGVRHPAHAVYPMDHFSREEMAELVADPCFVLIAGERLGAEDIAQPAAKPARKGA